MLPSTVRNGKTRFVSEGVRRRLLRVRDQFRTTPGLLGAALWTIGCLAPLFCFIVFAAARSQWWGMHAVAQDAIPSIVAAQEIKAMLADMHSNAANLLLAEPGKGTEAVNGYEDKRKEVTDQLISAAKNITYVSQDADQDERTQIKELLNHLGAYEALAAQAKVLHERKEPVAAALSKHLEADAIVHQALFRAADQLDRINRDQLDANYAAEQAHSKRWLAGVILSGLLLLGVLVATQLFLFRRMHRIINPGLGTATLVTLVFLAYAVLALQLEMHYLKIVKADAFDSIHALEQARACAYDANGDESRWLLESGNKEQADLYETAFHAKAGKLFRLPTGFTPARILSLAREGKALPRGVEGFLAAELSNITFAGEREAAVDTLDKWFQYVQIDEKIRELERAGRHQDAVTLCLGTKPGESNWAFERFDVALGDTVKINQVALDHAEQSGYAMLDRAMYLSLVAAVAVVVLAFLGLRSRLKEYAF